MSKKINWIIQYAQNKDLDSDSESSKTRQHQLFNFRHQTDRKLLPQFDSPVPRYSAKWIDGNFGGISSCSQTLLEERESTDFGLGVLQGRDATFCCSSVLWSNHSQVQKAEKAEGDSLTSVRRRHPQYSREERKYIFTYSLACKSVLRNTSCLFNVPIGHSHPVIQLLTIWSYCKICRKRKGYVAKQIAQMVWLVWGLFLLRSLLRREWWAFGFGWGFFLIL